VLGIAWAGTPVASSQTAARTPAALPKTPAPAPAATREPAPTPAAAEPTSQTTITSAEMPLTETPLYEVHFAYDSTQIAGEDADTIRKIASALVGEPKTQIRLTGHGDGIASADAEKELGLERAESVQRRLVLLGVDPSHVEVTAAEPAPETATVGAPAAARGAQNRRVDVSLVNE
jgi:outer membrane protein OmpA-like peptidoglycan-associated protein